MPKKRIYSLPIEYSNPTQISNLIKEYTVSILYKEGNRNGSWFDEEVVENMISTIKGLPVVGKWDAEKNDFLQHGDLITYLNNGELETKKESLPPYGYVPENAPVWWENRLDKDGVEREYLCTKVYTWNGRYPELNVLDNGKNNLSMELNPETVDGEFFDAEDGKTYYKFSKAEFFGLCILGADVEPCFEGANFSNFSLEDNTNYISNFKLMKEELAKALKEYSEEQESQSQSTETTEPAEPNSESVNEPVQESIAEPVTESEPEVTIESLLKDNKDLLDKIASLSSQYENLNKQFNTLKENYSSIETELNFYKQKEERAAKEEELNKYKSDLDKESYQNIFNKLDDMTIDEIKNQSMISAYSYMKKLLTNPKNSKTDDGKNINDFSLNTDGDIDPSIINKGKELTWYEQVAFEAQKIKNKK